MRIETLNPITSRDNARLKLVRSIAAGREHRLILLEGIRLAEEALRSSVTVTEAFFSDGALADQRMASLATRLRERNVPQFSVPDTLFAPLGDTETPQGIILLAERPAAVCDERLVHERSGALKIVLLLHEINNPSNLGAILRTAEAVGVSSVCVTKRSADPFSPKALRASMGAALRLPLVTSLDYYDIIARARKANLKVIAADIGGQTKYTDIDWQRPCLLIFGSEAHGLSAAELEAADKKIVIPLENRVESLNIAVSCGVILFEAKRRS